MATMAQIESRCRGSADDLLVNTHVLGAAAGSSPVLQLHHLPGGRMFTHYVDGFERTWDSGRTVEAADIT